VTATAAESRYAQVDGQSIYYELHGDEPPLVLLHGGLLTFVTVEHASEMQSILPDAQLAVVPGTTHNRLFHEVDIVAPILERFLNN
jgi:hypothetical protein